MHGVRPRFRTGPAVGCCSAHRSRRHNGIASAPRRTRPSPIISLAALIAVATVVSPGTLGFARTRGTSLTQKRHSPSSSCLQLSAKEEAAPLNFDQDLSNDPTSAGSLIGGPYESLSLKASALGAVSLLAFLFASGTSSEIASAYSSLLVEYPLPTKSLTSGALCGVSDTIAQFRDSTRKEFNYGRLIRFAGKGCIGGIIWSFWYDNLDQFLDMDSEINIYNIIRISGYNDGTHKWILDHTAIVKTSLSILIEQFFWCPIVFGTFEIPVSTLLNGGSFSTIQKEVDSKLNGLLVSNAKVWTLANVLIYNSPVQWRPAISNCVDLLWQSIVSEVAADCGKVEDDVCDVVEKTDRDYGFFAKKSRL